VLPGSILDRVPGRRRTNALAAALLTALVLVLAGCVGQREPGPAELRTSAPPWDAPRDAISYIKAAGFDPQPLNLVENQHVVRIRIDIDGRQVVIPGYVGIDRLRAVQAPVHTHDETGAVWLEGKDTAEVTLGQFFTVWGVRFGDGCIGEICGRLEVTVDGRLISSDPRGVRLASAAAVEVKVTSSAPAATSTP
jgi:hypothetical protein